MRLRNWLFQNFREVSRLFGFEELDFPVLESETLFIRKAGEEIRDQVLQEILRCYNIPENLFGNVCIIIYKIPLDDVKRELKSTGMSDEAVGQLLEVLSIKSLAKLEVQRYLEVLVKQLLI